VIATRGLTGLDHFLIGSVTERVVRKAPCPVFTLHTESDAEEEEA
jgi:nucleotide-binding universal stress UspA family protein